MLIRLIHSMQQVQCVLYGKSSCVVDHKKASILIDPIIKTPNKILPSYERHFVSHSPITSMHYVGHAQALNLPIHLVHCHLNVLLVPVS